MSWVNLNDVYVNKTGDTITGNLAVNGTLTANGALTVKKDSATYNVANEISTLRDSVSSLITPVSKWTTDDEGYATITDQCASGSFCYWRRRGSICWFEFWLKFSYEQAPFGTSPSLVTNLPPALVSNSKGSMGCGIALGDGGGVGTIVINTNANLLLSRRSNSFAANEAVSGFGVYECQPIGIGS